MLNLLVAVPIIGLITFRILTEIWGRHFCRRLDGYAKLIKSWVNLQTWNYYCKIKRLYKNSGCRLRRLFKSPFCLLLPYFIALGVYQFKEHISPNATLTNLMIIATLFAPVAFIQCKWRPKNYIFALYFAVFTAYSSLYAMTWANYEFQLDRGRQQITVVATLMTTPGRTHLGPFISELSRNTFPARPDWFSAVQIFQTIFLSEAAIERLPNAELNNDLMALVSGFEDWQNVDFSYAYFPKIDLSNKKLNGANFTGAHLSGAEFQKSEMVKSTFDGANLQSAGFIHADLSGASFHMADLTGAKLNFANLSSTTFWGGWYFDTIDYTIPASPRLAYSSIVEPVLSGQMVGPRLNHGELSRDEEVNFYRVRLNHANLSNANLSKASLIGVDMSEVTMDETILTGAWIMFSDFWLVSPGETNHIDSAKKNDIPEIKIITDVFGCISILLSRPLRGGQNDVVGETIKPEKNDESGDDFDWRLAFSSYVHDKIPNTCKEPIFGNTLIGRFESEGHTIRPDIQKKPAHLKWYTRQW